MDKQPDSIRDIEPVEVTIEQVNPVKITVREKFAQVEAYQESLEERISMLEDRLRPEKIPLLLSPGSPDPWYTSIPVWLGLLMLVALIIVLYIFFSTYKIPVTRLRELF